MTEHHDPLTGFYHTLLEVLEKDPRCFTEDGELLRNKVVELSNKGDADLLRILMGNEETKSHFFTDVDDVLVFDSQRFVWVVSNRDFLPDSYTRFANAIGLVDDAGRSIAASRDTELVWPFKDCWLEGGQSKDDESREEVFYNETLAPDQVDRLLHPKVLTGAVRFNQHGSDGAADFQADDNLIIKGNNLLGIASLLPRYEGRVDVIYIDPPYNPSNKSNNTFCYNNRFNHSTWLTFMANRLRIAGRLLRDDGALICAIDDNEHSYLGVLLQELFPDHDVESIVIVHNPRGVQGTNFSYTHESAYFVLPKNMRTVGDQENGDVVWTQFRNWGGESRREDAATCFYPVIVKDGEVVGFGDVMPDDQHPTAQTVEDGDHYLVYPIDGKGVERKWRYARRTVEGTLLRARGKKAGGYEIEIGKSSGMYKTVWVDPRYDANRYGTQLVKELVPDAEFDFPKSLYTVLDCIKTVAKDRQDALVLDFFAGSGTTGHAVLELNREDGGHRRFILVEQMDYVETITAKRVAQVIENNGEGSFVYCELKQLNQALMNQLEAAETSDDLLTVWEQVRDTGFVSYRVLADQFNPETFKALSFDQQRELVAAVLDKNRLYVNLCDIGDADYVISDHDKAFNASFYGETP